MNPIPEKIKTWRMVSPFSRNEAGEIIAGRLEMTETAVPELKPDEVLVEVAGCGVCHTDLGYFFDGVPTVERPPLTLGHEISGRVVAGDPAWIGKEVLVPTVMPCRRCFLCKTGRGNRCLNQKMPGNSLGKYGGFASHIPVPGLDLCEIKNRGGLPLSHLAVVADAVTTPFQAARRAGLQTGDQVVVVGVCGGVGQYMGQLAKALGAGTVVGIDRNPERLKRSLEYGVDLIIDSGGKKASSVAAEFREFGKARGLPSYGWKIFEVSGAKAGQEIALSLLGFTGKLIVVGFNTDKIEYSISRLMAFDAEIIGTWGCLPEYYPLVLDLVLSRKIQIEPFVEPRPMSRIRETFEELHKSGSPARRIVLEADF
jgi:6-hydroxycyclohex-1-ene-1-carbonyl-CoA dehydrogenase